MTQKHCAVRPIIAEKLSRVISYTLWQLLRYYEMLENHDRCCYYSDIKCVHDCALHARLPSIPPFDHYARYATPAILFISILYIFISPKGQHSICQTSKQEKNK